MSARPSWGEPMPGRVFDFTPEQDAVIRAIEKRTRSEVVILAPFPPTTGFGSEYHEGFLSRPEEYLCKREAEDFPWYIPWAEENGELSYLCDNPTERMMTEKELRQYPEIIRTRIEEGSASSGTGTCNVVSSRCFGAPPDDIDHVLQELHAFTALLAMGWHLGREQDFADPFVPEAEPPSEEEQLWQEYEEDRRRNIHGS